MVTALLLLGSNLGKREEYLQNAINLITYRCGTIIRQSPVYETKAWGNTQQQDFLNLAITLNTKFEPHNLLTALKGIEQEIGRSVTQHWGPREIDIDILLLGDLVVASDLLQIPHPQLPQRRFALTPANDIAADMLHPVMRKTISELLSDCPDVSPVNKWE